MQYLSESSTGSQKEGSAGMQAVFVLFEATQGHTERSSKSSVSKPVCKVPKCTGLNAESLHDMMIGSSLIIKAVECEE
jgi:hypothetical protein